MVCCIIYLVNIFLFDLDSNEEYKNTHILSRKKKFNFLSTCGVIIAKKKKNSIFTHRLFCLLSLLLCYIAALYFDDNDQKRKKNITK